METIKVIIQAGGETAKEVGRPQPPHLKVPFGAKAFTRNSIADADLEIQNKWHTEQAKLRTFKIKGCGKDCACYAESVVEGKYIRDCMVPGSTQNAIVLEDGCIRIIE